MREIILSQDDYDTLPCKGSKLTKDDTIGDIIGLLRKRGIKKYAMDDEEETIGFEYKVKLPDMEQPMSLFVKLTVPHLKRYARVNPRNTSRNSPTELVYLENESWRILWWYLKNKLDAIRFGIVDDLPEFMGNVYYKLPDGREVNLADAIIANADSIAKTAQLTDESKKPVVDAEATFANAKKIDAEFEVKA